MNAKETKYIYGYHCVLAILTGSPQLVINLYLQTDKYDPHLKELIKIAQQHNIQFKYWSREKLTSAVCCDSHQGIIAEVSKEKTYTENDLKLILKKSNLVPLFLILDEVQDPHNLGACLRSANAAGVSAVIAPKNNACGLTSVVCKVACGAALITPFIQVTNLARVMNMLKENNIWIVGTCETSQQDIYHSDFTMPLAFVMGGEGDGMRHLTKKHCDFVVKIPIVGVVNSLNVSVATGVCLFEALRQRLNCA